jgi:hypothetical protein
MIKKYRFQIVFTLIELVLALIGQVDFVENNPILLSIFTALFLVITPILYHFFTRKIQETLTFWFVFYAIFRITPIVFLMKGNIFESIFRWKIYLNIMFFVFLFLKIITLIRNFREEIKQRKNDEQDDYSLISNVLQKSIRFEKLGRGLAFEICSFYYCFIKWKGDSSGDNQFSGYKNSGVIGYYVAFIFLSFIEAGGLHLLLISWNKNAAIMFLFLHIYVLINVIGHLKALIFRKHFISSDKILIRYGLFDTLEIPVNLIAKISKFEGDYEKNENLVKFALLGKLEPHNIAIELKENIQVFLPFGIMRRPNRILFYLDEPHKILGLL